jgi:uncharacterized protein YqgC (DUF456 family)
MLAHLLTALPYILYALLILLSLAAVALNVISLPGNWLMLLCALLISWYSGWNAPTLGILAFMLLVLLAGELIETMGSLVGAKKFGASTLAAWAAIAGGLVGGILGTFLIPIPLFGSVIGAITGAFLAAWSIELIKQKPFKAATWGALGAALGRVMGMGAKIACGLAVWFLLIVTAFPR